jgi:DNA-binding CsgD family transcriptional regulator
MSAALVTVFDERLAAPDLKDIAVRTATAQRGSDEPDRSRAVLDIWVGLVEGRLHVVERFETADRRYYVVRDSDLPPSPLTSLGAKERQLMEILGSGESEKTASFALGVGAPAISLLLKSSLAKLGLQSRTDLVLLLRSMSTG